MSDTEKPVGNLYRSTPQAVAEKAARTILTFTPGSTRAVTVDPRGRAFVEPASSAAEADLVGVYRVAGSWVTLAALIERDLRACRPARSVMRRTAA